MAVYRITRFASPDMDKAVGFAESMRDVFEGVGADFIDIVSYRNGKGVVLAKYPDQTTMDAASDAAKQAFGKIINS